VDPPERSDPQPEAEALPFEIADLETAKVAVKGRGAKWSVTVGDNVVTTKQGSRAEAQATVEKVERALANRDAMAAKRAKRESDTQTATDELPAAIVAYFKASASTDADAPERGLPFVQDDAEGARRAFIQLEDACPGACAGR
jgi:hypothetical protein